MSNCEDARKGEDPPAPDIFVPMRVLNHTPARDGLGKTGCPDMANVKGMGETKKKTHMVNRHRMGRGCQLGEAQRWLRPEG